jgi:hypothetical protein
MYIAKKEMWIEDLLSWMSLARKAIVVVYSYPCLVATKPRYSNQIGNGRRIDRGSGWSE